MSGYLSFNFLSEFFFDWSLALVSMFNTILLFWLGLIVVLNAEKRTWGIWLATGGLLLGGTFFAFHTAALDYSLDALLAGIHRWWYWSWLAVIVLPFFWYVLMLWYASYWDDDSTPLHRRQRPWLCLVGCGALGLIVLVLRVSPYYLLRQVAHPGGSAPLAPGGVPLLVLFYPFYILLCQTLSLDALHRPGPTGRMMGDLARRRARPWLMASSLVQFIVSLMVAGMLLWIVLYAHWGALDAVYDWIALVVNLLDLIITTLIAVAVILMGKAVVSYEIFTGKTLPRRGFLRQWRGIVTLAAAYSTLVSLSWAMPLRPVYPLMLTTVLVSVFYALFSWRSYAERENYMAYLRPFVASQHLYEHLLTRVATGGDVEQQEALQQEAEQQADAAAPFGALCDGVLNASVAYLIALGPLAPLSGPPLVFPPTAVASLPALGEITAQLHSPRIICVMLDPARHGGALWAVPLWSERGLIGVLLLGEKRDGGLYTQEEIEIARASGERLIDTRASSAMAQRLMALQRQRLAESQVLDRRARRMLHDDVLPRLHTAMLTLSNPGVALNGTAPEGANQDTAEPESPAETALAQLAEAHRQISNLLHEMPTTTAPEVARLGLLGALRRTVEEELTGAFDEVSWHIEPEAEQACRHIPSLTAEALFYAAREAIRNAARYAGPADGSRPVQLRVAATWDDGLHLMVEDNGVGLGAAEQAASGSGHGLALHSTMMAVVGGSLATESVPDQYTRVVLCLPQSASTHA